MVKQITVEELFGSPLPKEPSLLTKLAQNTSASGDFSSSYVHNQPYLPPAHHSPLLTAHGPSSNQQQQAPGLIPAPYVLNPSPVFQSVVPRSDPQSHCSVSPLMIPPAGPEDHTSPAGPTASAAASATYLRKEIISTLKPTVPSVNSEIHKPILAPNFLPNALVPPHSFQELKMDVFSQPPNLVKPMTVSSTTYLCCNPILLAVCNPGC